MHRGRTRRRERACVYTTLLGGYEQLTEQPAAAESGIDFVCLTDDPTLESETWEIRHVQPVFSEDPTRSQRMLKIRAHAVFPEYGVSLYIDNSILLRQAPERAMSDLLPAGATFAAMSHGLRSSVTAEFAEVVRTGLDGPDRCAEQEQHYRLRDPESLELQPLKSGLLLRRHHDPRVVAAMELWAAHVLRYSRRDQLSLWLCLREAKVEPLVHALNNFESPYHRWPVSVGRSPRDQPWTELSGELTATRVRIAQLESEIELMRNSRSWRWTERVRRVTEAWRRHYPASSASTSPEPSQEAASR